MAESLRRRFERAVAAGDGLDLARAALVIASIDHQPVDEATALTELDALAAGAQLRVGDAGPPSVRAQALMDFLFRERGFRGNHEEYYDPRNSCLDEVLTRRLGIPITLSVVAMEVGARLGLRLAGVAFPGHFLVRAAAGRGETIFDPFHGGSTVDHDELLWRLKVLAEQAGRPAPEFHAVPAEFLADASRPAIVSRMLRNLHRIYTQRDDHARALAAVDLLLVLTPNAPEEVRTRGALYEQLDCPAAAAADFRRYLQLAPQAPDAADVEKRLSRLRDTAPTIH
ncbi:MAG TPA: tetratricopeptide repeat protein [Candidatus Limnocylindria bacterium]|nr:tetratricopeptide repeat protein [Candidatus Limnocylindria bacterium]